jgi:hypothetical protein
MRLKRLILFTSALLILFASVILIIAEPVFAGTGLTQDFVDQNPILPKTGTRASTHPSLVEFRSSLSYEHDDRIVGIYAPGSFALPVVQQPASNPGFVSTKPEVVTQFGLATDYGTIGFLAHNTLSGAHFFDLEVGQTVVLVYGDGSVKTFIIRDRLSYQALSPNSPYSRFKDLNSTELEISSTDLFNQVYTDDGQLVFQTCIASDGVDNWGRYFVLAVPAGRIPHYGHGLFQVKVPTFH